MTEQEKKQLDQTTINLLSEIDKSLKNGATKGNNRPIFGGGFMGVDWGAALERYGVSFVGLTAVSILLVWVFILPMRETNEKMIESNIETQKSLTESVRRISEEMEQNHDFMKDVGLCHEEQLKVLENNQTTNETIKGLMEDANEMMKDVPEFRQKQLEVLNKINTYLESKDGSTS